MLKNGTDTREIERARARIGDEGDGPITTHDLISRTVHQAALASSPEALEALVEALYEELYDRKLLREAQDFFAAAV